MVVYLNSNSLETFDGINDTLVQSPPLDAQDLVRLGVVEAVALVFRHDVTTLDIARREFVGVLVSKVLLGHLIYFAVAEGARCREKTLSACFGDLHGADVSFCNIAHVDPDKRQARVRNGVVLLPLSAQQTHDALIRRVHGFEIGEIGNHGSQNHGRVDCSKVELDIRGRVADKGPSCFLCQLLGCSVCIGFVVRVRKRLLQSDGVPRGFVEHSVRVRRAVRVDNGGKRRRDHHPLDARGGASYRLENASGPDHGGIDELLWVAWRWSVDIVTPRVTV